MPTQATTNLIQTQLTTLSTEHGDPVPIWAVTEGTISFFSHDDKMIWFAQETLEFLEQTLDEVDLVGLIAHEFWHFHQFVNDLHQDRPAVREVNSRRFARTWVRRVFPGREDELNLQGIGLLGSMAPTEPGVDEIAIPRAVVSETVARRFANATPEEQLFLNEAFKPFGRPINTSKWVRFKLQRDGPSYPYKLWRDFREFLEKFDYKAPSYTSIKNLVWRLKKLGLVRVVGTEPSQKSGLADRQIYDVVPELASDESWGDPLEKLYLRA